MKTYYKITGVIDKYTNELVVEVTDTDVYERYVTNSRGESWLNPKERTYHFYHANTPTLFESFKENRKDLEITELSEEDLFTIYL